MFSDTHLPVQLNKLIESVVTSEVTSLFLLLEDGNGKLCWPGFHSRDVYFPSREVSADDVSGHILALVFSKNRVKLPRPMSFGNSTWILGSFFEVYLLKKR